MSSNTLSIANAILDEASKQGLAVTPMQLQKLLYFLNGWHMELNQGQPIVPDQFQAWQFGPVSPAAYHEYKRFGSEPIDGRAKNPISGETWSINLSKNQNNLIEEIVRIYGSLSGPQMSHLTHQDGTPWSNTWKGGVGRGDPIPREDILEEFQKIRSRATAA